jgi:ABC-type dipeptide/oligopeptide/nickel transport system permease subunit
MLDFGTPLRTYYARFTVSMGLYVAAIVGVSAAFARDLIPARFAAGVALLPALPLVLVALTILAYLRKIDELQRKVQLDAMAFSFALTSVTTFSYGLLQSYARAPAVSWTFVWPVLAVYWVIGLWFSRRRYA